MNRSASPPPQDAADATTTACAERPWTLDVPGERPSGLLRVFIGGCERSGTTFLGSQVSRWAGLVFLPESYFLLSVLRGLENDPSACARDLILKSWRVDAFNLDRSALREALTPSMSALECMDTLARLYAEAIGQQTYAGWVEHTPFNTANTRLIDRHFPDVRFINVLRDGRAVAASILNTDFGPCTVGRAAVWWRAHTLPGLLAQIEAPDRVLVLRFEDLVNQEAATRSRIIRFLGLADALVDGQVPVRVDPYFEKTHSLVSGPADTSRTEAWRKTLSDQQVEDFEFSVGDTLRALGYVPVYGVSARERRYYRYVDALVDAFLSLFWQLPRRVLRRYLTHLKRRR